MDKMYGQIKVLSLVCLFEALFSWIKCLVRSSPVISLLIWSVIFMDQMFGCDSEVQGWNLLTKIIYVFNVLSTSVENLLVVKVLKTHQSLLLNMSYFSLV